jgi:hypothetical protein
MNDDKGYFVHESSYVDEPCQIGAGTKIWHFSHVMANCVIGPKCNIGQNVVISPGVRLGEGCKIQNNVSLYTGVVLEDFVFCGPSMVFTNVVNPRSEVVRKDEYRRTLVRRGASIRRAPRPSWRRWSSLSVTSGCPRQARARDHRASMLAPDRRRGHRVAAPFCVLLGVRRRVSSFVPRDQEAGEGERHGKHHERDRDEQISVHSSRS